MTSRYAFISCVHSKTGVLAKDQPLVRAIQAVLAAHGRALQDHKFVDDCVSVDEDLMMDLFRGGEFFQEALNPDVNFWLFRRDRLEFAFMLFSVLMQSDHPPQADPGDLMDLLIVLCQGMNHAIHIMEKLPRLQADSEAGKNLIRYVRKYSAGRLADLTGWELLILYSALKRPSLPDSWRDMQMQIDQQTSIYRRLFLKLATREEA